MKRRTGGERKFEQEKKKKEEEGVGISAQKRRRRLLTGPTAPRIFRASERDRGPRAAGPRMPIDLRAGGSRGPIDGGPLSHETTSTRGRQRRRKHGGKNKR